MDSPNHLDLMRDFLYLQFKFPKECWERIAEFAEIIHFPKNEYFVREGVVCRRMAFIAEGVMRYCMTREGEDITCYFSCENEFVGDPDSFVQRKPSERNAQALTDCVLVCISRSNIGKVFAACPEFEQLTPVINHRVMMGLMLQRDFLQHAEAAQKYRHFIETYPHILQRVPLAYIASFLGITPQSLSRLRKEIF